MIRSLAALLAFAAALALPASSFSAAPAKAPARAAPAAAASWPQAQSDIAADPAIRFGVLPNGLRYAIRRQTIPPRQASLRLWINAGSLMEEDAQQGLAHFLEHMAFNGSKAVKEGEMVKILERLGLSFGADTNASTGFSETIYKLDLPKTDDETLDTSLMLLREAASNLTIDPAAVDRERGVVLSEERATDQPGYRVSVQRLSFLMKGQRVPTRLPIGKVEVLRGAPASQVAAYYHRWYRPERSVLVAVGDFDVAAMEAKLRARFADWRAAAPAPPLPSPGAVAPRGPEAKLVIEPGAPQTLQVTWVSEPDRRPDTFAKRRENLIENLGFAVLNRRFSRIVRSANPPFLNAGAGVGEQERAIRTATIGIRAEPGRWREALAAAEQEQRRAVTFGVRQDELEREIAETRTQLQAAVAGAATRRPVELAGEILSTLADREVVTSPAQDLAFFESVVKGLQAETVSAALKRGFRGQGPLVFMASPTPVEGGETALLAALKASQAVAVAPTTANALVAWPYQSFGVPGTVAETRKADDLGVTFIRFANGVRLTVKPTAFRDDEILVRVGVGDGLLDLPSDRPGPTWASNVLVEGGLKKIETEDIDRALATKLAGVRFRIDEEAFSFTGSTRPADLLVQMQLLAAYATEAAWRPAAFERIKANGKTFHDQFEATDGGVLQRDLQALLHGGDKRWAFPSRDEIAGARLEQISAPLNAALAGGPIEVVVVGDVTVEAARDAVAATFGALPPRPEAPSPPTAARRISFPAGTPQPQVLTHKGRADQAIGYMAWPTADYLADPQRTRETSMLAEVLRLRLTEQLREAQGATYSPGVGNSASTVFPGYGYLSATVEVPPARLDAFFADVDKIAADLAAREIGPDELARAKAPRVEQLQKNQLTNNFWLSQLSWAQWEPSRLDLIRNSVPGARKVTAADIRRAAQTWLKPEKAFRLVVTPAAAP